MLGAIPALAQDSTPNEHINIQLAEAGPDCLWLSYNHYPGTSARIYDIDFRPTSQVNYIDYSTEAAIAPLIETPGLIKFTDLQADLSHEIIVYMDDIPGQTSFQAALHYYSTGAADSLPCGYVPPAPKSKPAPTPMPTPRPPANTCPNLLPDIIVSGYVSYASQCQVVMGAGVGRQDLLDRGVIAAVDIWSLVPHTGVEVCFRNLGAQVVFLDAAYSPRLLSTLDYTVRDGMTCAAISTTGTVVLLAS